VDATPLAFGLWAATGAGVLSVVVAPAVPHLRRTLFVVAAVLFLPIGILGILSVGGLFLLAAAACVVAAARSGRDRPPTRLPPHGQTRQ
jgi:hypothetical protein